MPSKCTCIHGRPWYAACLDCDDAEQAARVPAPVSPAFEQLRQQLRRAMYAD